jgi:hypothetical protein
MDEIDKARGYFAASHPPSEIKLNFSKQREGTEQGAYYDPDCGSIIVYSSSGNPHELNSESRCQWEELLTQSGENGIRVKFIIISNFGEEAYYHLIFSIMQHLYNTH